MGIDLKHIVTTLRNCRLVPTLRYGKSLHSHLIKTGHSHNMYIAGNLISMYVNCSLLVDACKQFDEMPEKNIFTWTTMISAYTNFGKPYESIKLYIHMLDSKAEVPNGFTYSAVLKACGLVGDIELGKRIHEKISREDLDNDIVLMNTLLDMYVKCGSLDDAREVFDGILMSANSVTWNTLISGYCNEGLMYEAVNLFNQMPERNTISWNIIIAGFVENKSLRALDFVCRMHEEGFELDDFTFPCALKLCCYVGFSDMGKQIHCYAIKSGFTSSCFTVSALVDMYSNCNLLTEAVTLFDWYSGCNYSTSDSLALQNSMLSGYVINGQNREALNMLSKIHLSDAYFDSYTYASALKVCINLLSITIGSQVHGLVVISGYELDYVVGNLLADLYAKRGNIKEALGLFHRLPKKDTVTWSGLMTCCSKMGLNSLALSLFRDMVKLQVEVDQYVISNVVKVCSSLASLGNGKQIHAFCIRNGYETDGVTVTALIDMYSKCGEIENSLTLFHSTVEKDIVCWTGIIVGCGQNGRAKEAVEFYRKMIQIGLKPNEVTFLGVLTACRHAGYLKEAWGIFESMKIDHGLEPQMEHYYCMVELLGHAGCFNDAMKLISKMPFKSDKTIWISLLGACGIHRNAELVRTIENNLLASFSDDPSVYIMLSNTYATLGMWDNLSKVRESAKRLGVKKGGTSWIEI
ncbi:pentatricopeptide repeat-containing protein At4g08210 [Mercurialis annua]|uniref:pentatricopeptide repeat-containing protein At4g08210 n=1 Tax=Mercurialis annua TaxID=3986 RepID=UPI00215EC2DE|nr:pentatricopeptide repeat-containing protein At4g08210 [Mercurialis annua]